MKRTWKAVAACAAALVLGACSAGSGGLGAGGGGQTDELKVGTFLDLTSWDPAKADIGFDGPYLSAVYDPLVALNDKSQPIPALATQWSYSPDGLTLTMKLRTGVTFDDGKPFDADAAVVNLEHLKNGVRSSDAYQDVTSITKVDNDTIALHLKQRDDTLLYFMGLGRSWMASPAAIESGSLDKGPDGSGPYTYEVGQSTPGSKYVFTKKKNYWDSATYPFSTVRLMPITDQTASLNAMLSGQLNVDYANPADTPKAQQNNWNVASGVATWVGLQFVDRAGQHVPALGDVRVRQAINYAFDSAAMLHSIGNNAGELTNQLFPVGDPAYNPALNSRYAYNLSKAKQLMAEAGYAHGFSVTMPMATMFQVWQPAVEQTFHQLGIDVKWDNMSPADYQKNAPTYPLFIAVVAMDSNMMATVKRQITEPQWYNPDPAIESQPEMARLVQTAQATTGQAQVDAVRQLNAQLIEKAYNAVWYQANNTYFSVHGIKVTPITGTMFPPLRFIQRG
ncbi:ABC transporter substrate-binding protein [Speluncibacter jeojiensis]|uniref:ABC transporter substrate-binding protein n=1 Tax=Speluncibacter jeojiensis TaxID=2710754 RepID=A0A9X4RFS2_9ACTN|nr:ABC transporter substrate-binding protein [Corynebacteriales bacterium D3-21]